ncbi:DUF2285 domain-containing protein [Agrobacterium tumefaciens]|uniref:DUF2285 domain-containing protein n=1 Tax=Agrobacterium tumefaciens TaxID=358 RepID=UPI0022434FED|nr:DUF2285 domain-containing protein [Agrobacterium tumefaciens]MCW8147159.1 DUF2285 domain-containing protein [Agrobacterium tumefaciens]
MIWSAEADTSTVLLTQMPIVLPAAGNLYSGLPDIAERADDDGTHFVFEAGGQTIRLLRLAGILPETPLAALVPLNADGFDRTEAIDRLLRALLGRAVPDDRRLTPQQKRRHRHMLQATDGRMNGATYRDIASVIFGVDRVASEPWKTSALRDATTALVKDGLAMIAGGYRMLLRHRRRS